MPPSMAKGALKMGLRILRLAGVIQGSPVSPHGTLRVKEGGRGDRVRKDVVTKTEVRVMWLVA